MLDVSCELHHVLQQFCTLCSLIQVTDVEMLDILAEYQHKEAYLKAFLQVSQSVYDCTKIHQILLRVHIV